MTPHLKFELILKDGAKPRVVPSKKAIRGSTNYFVLIKKDRMRHVRRGRSTNAVEERSR